MNDRNKAGEKPPKPPTPFVEFNVRLLGCGHCVRVLSCSDITLYNNGAIVNKPDLFDEPNEIFAYVEMDHNGKSKWYRHLKLVGDDGQAMFYETDNGIAVFAEKDDYDAGNISVYPSWDDLVKSVSKTQTQMDDLNHRYFGKWKNIEYIPARPKGEIVRLEQRKAKKR